MLRGPRRSSVEKPAPGPLGHLGRKLRGSVAQRGISQIYQGEVGLPTLGNLITNDPVPNKLIQAAGWNIGRRHGEARFVSKVLRETLIVPLPFVATPVLGLDEYDASLPGKNDVGL